MRYNIPATATTVEQITQSVNQCLGRLLQKRQLDEAAHDDFAAARSILEAMPLSTDEYGLACTRLKNAQHYLRYTEPGAAWYELRLLASSLRTGEQQVREPRRRLRRRAGQSLQSDQLSDRNRTSLAFVGGSGLRCPLG